MLRFSGRRLVRASIPPDSGAMESQKRADAR